MKPDIVLLNNKGSNKLDIRDNKFSQLMNLYTIAMKELEQKVNLINRDYREIYGQDLINHMVSRLKTPDSIIKKMLKKNYDLTYKNLVENINDIAGVRIICPFKNNVFEVADIIREFENCKIIKEKDYINKPKKTGYSSYHMIVEVPAKLNGVEMYVKVEVQIRTMAMDFWSTLEHQIKYKSKSEITPKVSRDLVMYAKIINRMDHKLMKLNNRSKHKIQLLK